MEGREKVLRQALHNVNKMSVQHGCLCTPLGRNFRDKQNLQRYFWTCARLLLLSWNGFDLDSFCWLAVKWGFTQSDVSSNDHDWLWLMTNNLRLDCLNMSIMRTQPHCVELLLSMCVCYMILLSECYSFIYWALWPLCIFYLYTTLLLHWGFAWSLCTFSVFVSLFLCGIELSLNFYYRRLH